MLTLKIMKKIFTIAAALLTMAGCGPKSNTDMNQNELKEVAGRKNFGPQHVVMVPQPCIMIATYDENQNPDVMMMAWGGQCDFNQIELNLSSHKTTDNIRLKKAFTISFATENDIAESDYFGLVGGKKDPDKVKRVGFTVTPSPNVDAPIVNEYKLTLECKAVLIEDNEDGGARIVGEIVNWSADESILDADGKVDVAKLKPIVFDPAANVYRSVGDSVGKAWGSGKKFQ